MWMPQRHLALEFRDPGPMDSEKTEYDIADHLNDSRRSGSLSGPASFSGYAGRVAGFCNAEYMTSVSLRRGRAQRWALLAALTLFVGQAVADVHLHLDEHEEEACTLCAISEPGHVPEVGQVDAQPSDWQRSNSLVVYSATLSRRPYEISRSRAPPVSLS